VGRCRSDARQRRACGGHSPEVAQPRASTSAPECSQVRKATNQTLAAFGVEYVQKYASVELAAATRATNRVLWNRYVLPKLGCHQMVVLAHQPEIVQEFKAELVADGVGDPTIKRTLTVLSAVLGKAVEWNRIPSNPVATVRKPSGKRSKPVCTLAPEVVERSRKTWKASAWG
jgi:hypothetical protein